MIKERYVEYETAKLACESGFDIQTEKCYGELKEYTYEDVRNHGKDKVVESKPPHLITRQLITEHSHRTFICYAPTQALLHRWLREKHELFVSIYPLKTGWAFDVRPTTPISSSKTQTIEGHDTYEDALEVGLNKGLKLIK